MSEIKKNQDDFEEECECDECAQQKDDCQCDDCVEQKNKEYNENLISRHGKEATDISINKGDSSTSGPIKTKITMDDFLKGAITELIKSSQEHEKIIRFHAEKEGIDNNDKEKLLQNFPYFIISAFFLFLGEYKNLQQLKTDSESLTYNFLTNLYLVYKASGMTGEDAKLKADQFSKLLESLICCIEEGADMSIPETQIKIALEFSKILFGAPENKASISSFVFGHAFSYLENMRSNFQKVISEVMIVN